MIDTNLGLTIETMRQRGLAIRAIARQLGISRNTVRRVINGDRQPKSRPSRLVEHLELIQTLFGDCKGNLVRVHQILTQDHGIDISYSALTALTRKYRIRKPAKKQSGAYVFEPGAEMQHDTTECRITLGNKKKKLQCAGLVLGYSRMAYIQFYPRFTRFEALVFLNQAFEFMGGSCQRCTIDNTSVLVADGSGPDALIAQKVRRFAAHWATRFIPHAIGHADRKAHVEKLFAYVQNNFLAGRRFADLNDLNHQAIAWCNQTANQKIKRSLGKSPCQAMISERPFLIPLPPYIPQVYHSQHRVVDIYGHVHLETNRYSVPYQYIGQTVEVQKYIDVVKVFAGQTLIAEHDRVIYGRNRKVCNPEHRSPRLQRKKSKHHYEKLLIGQNTVLDQYVSALKRAGHTRRLKPLLALKRTYPPQPFFQAVKRALKFSMFDINRLENIIIELAAQDLFDL